MDSWKVSYAIENVSFSTGEKGSWFLCTKLWTLMFLKVFFFLFFFTHLTHKQNIVKFPLMIAGWSDIIDMSTAHPYLWKAEPCWGF